MTSHLSSEIIRSACRPDAQHVAIRLVAETGSTNVDLLADIANLAGPTLLIAERQTAGKGRAGRTWHAEPGATLTFSLAWKFNLAARGLLGLPLVVGVVIAEALAQFGVDSRLKWPNDILRDGKKLAGMLIETANDKDAGGKQVWAVIGIGINLQVTDALTARIGHEVAAASILQADRNLLLAAIVNGLVDALHTFESNGFQAFRERWNALHAYRDQQVCVIDNGRAIHQGIALGVDDNGCLLLDTESGTVAVMAGDISLRVKGN